MCVPEVGRQDGQTSLGILTVAIPAQQRLDRKSVSKIVQARSAAVVHTTQPNLPGQGVERRCTSPLSSWLPFLFTRKVLRRRTPAAVGVS